MSDIKDWSTAAASNNAASPNGFPESMAPSGVNDSAREVMAATRRWYDDAEWINIGITPSYATTLSFTLAGDRTSKFHAGRRVKCEDASVLYGTIASSSYSTNTRVSLTLDSGGLTTSLSSVSVGMLSFAGHSVPDITAGYAISAGAVTGTVVTDTISEQSAGAGVTIDGFGIKDNAPNPTSWPSFSVNKNGTDQTSVGTALTLITWSTEEFDTNSDFASNRFTPTVAGKYLLTAQLTFLVVADGDVLRASIKKNGVEYKSFTIPASTATANGIIVTAIVDANGSSDYFEIYGTNETSADTISGLTSLTYFMGSRIA